ncbi:uncharacterized protein [Rhodnius prolixus]|uniref:Uncharacterized protein n=1 Tax=Rhodnius prolixus TaxID=13249 RepID=T1HCD9_RHOPR
MSLLLYVLVVGFCVHTHGEKSGEKVEERISGPSATGFQTNVSIGEFQRGHNGSSFGRDYHNPYYVEEVSDESYENVLKSTAEGLTSDQHEEDTITGPSAFGFDSYESVGETMSEQNQRLLSNSYVSNYGQIPSINSETNSKLKVINVEKKILVPYPVTREKKIPYKEEIPVDILYPVPVPKPYPVTIEKKVPFKAKVHVPVPYIVEKKIPFKIEIPVNKPYQVSVPKPYNVYLEKKIPQTEVKYVPFEVKVPVDKPYPVLVPVVKHVPYTIEKRIPIEVKVPINKPYTVEILKPYKIIVEKKVPYILEKHVPYEIKVPVEVPIPVVKHVPIVVPKKADHSSIIVDDTFS